MQVKRSRALLALIVVLVCTPLLIPATPPPRRVQAATTRATGSPGTATIRDTESSPGTICQHLVLDQRNRVTITVNAPTARAFSGDSARLIEWQPLVHQLFPDGSVELVTAGTVQNRLVDAATTAVFAAETFAALPEGSVYQTGGVLTWRNSDSSVRGTITIIYENYRIVTSGTQSQVTGGCFPVHAAELTVSASRVTVDTKLLVQGRYFPANAPVAVIWNGKTVATWMSDADGQVSGTLKTPAAPIGNRSLQLTAGAWWKAGAVITIAPRIRMLPATAARGDTVKISLRGFAKRESVRIRWKQGSRWVELGWVTMSNTGSGELWIPVPAWAADGANSVRGDGSVGRAQTNVAMISGGFFAAAGEATPTALASATPEAIASPLVEPDHAVDDAAGFSPTASPDDSSGSADEAASPVGADATPDTLAICSDDTGEIGECPDV